MAHVATFDELNELGIKRRSMPYEQYFGEMGIPEEEKERRKDLAEQIETIFRYMFMLYGTEYTAEELRMIVYEQFLNVSTAFLGIAAPTAYLMHYTAQLAEETVRVTEERASEEDPYWTSEDRAVNIAEGEANSIGNYGDLEDAIREGKYLKTWATMGDNRVRGTHKEVDGVSIPIEEPFEVGDSLLMFPRDTSLGASRDEIDGCRCWLEFP